MRCPLDEDPVHLGLTARLGQVIAQGRIDLPPGDRHTRLGCRHRLSNPGKIPVELIEVQSGPYLGEDDIVRFEDVYGRSPEAKSP